MKRNHYDLGSMGLSSGHIGRLKTIHRMPIIAGDSISMQLEMMLRLAPLRRQLTIDCMVDICTFFVPYRHIYGDAWNDFIREGAKETQTFPSRTPGVRLSCCASNLEAAAVNPEWIPAGYERIYNRYFNIPQYGSDPLSSNYRTFVNNALYNDTANGFLCCRPHVPWSTGIDSSSDTKLDVNQNTIDILDLERVRALYGSDQQREWFAQRYTDVLKAIWHTSVNIDADERPEFVHRETKSMSGYDVDGTGDGNLGYFAGKSVARLKYMFPRKFFSEHGTLWTTLLLRFPAVHGNEIHPLDRKPNPSYLEVSADPKLWEAEPPITLQLEDWFWNQQGTVANGLKIPYGQWYRHHNNNVDEIFDQRPGFPIPDIEGGTNNLAAMYYRDNEYFEMFNGRDTLGEWQAYNAFGVNAMRAVSTSGKSIFAGAK